MIKYKHDLSFRLFKKTPKGWSTTSQKTKFFLRKYQKEWLMLQMSIFDWNLILHLSSKIF